MSDLLDELAAVSSYHHQLALVSATAAGDQDRLQAALTHPNPRIRSFAFANLARLGLAVDDIREAILAGSAEDRRRLRRFINRSGRTDIAEAIIDDVRAVLGDREAATLLSTCGAETVGRLLPELLYSIPNLASLARRHPGPLLGDVTDLLSSYSQRRRDLLWSQIDSALGDLAVLDADRMLGLVEELGPTWVLPHGLQGVLGHLIRHSAHRVAGLITQPEWVESIRWRLPSGLRRNAHHFDHDDRVSIARSLREQEPLFFSFLERLPPSDRSEVFSEAAAGLDRTQKVWQPGFLDVLPESLRHEEARRILALRVVEDSVSLQRQYTAFLPFDEARTTLEAELGRPKAEDRASGYQLYIACCRRERSSDALTEVLNKCQRLRNEQDPVRLAAIQSLTTVSHLQVTDGHIPELRSLATAVVHARDTWPARLQSRASFAPRLLSGAGQEQNSHQFDFGLELLDLLAGPMGTISLPPLDRLLRSGADAALIDSLVPRLERDAARGRFGLTLALTQSLQKRAWQHERLQQLVLQATTAANDTIVQRAIALRLADPRHRGTRLAEIVDADPSTLALPAVLNAVNRSRQDLLDVLLRKRPLRGRFLKGDARYVPIILSGFHRWLPRQCEAYQDALEDLITTPGTAAWTSAAAVRTLARLPEIGTEAIRPFLGSNEVALQEAALGGMAWTDQPALALDDLLGHADSDRARVAVYSATRCARFVPRNQVLTPLARVLTQEDAKITSKKEAARILGTHRPEGWLDQLLDLAAEDSIHRDLLIAIGRTVRVALDDDRVWSLLNRLAVGSEDQARSLLETTPAQIAPLHRPRFADLIIQIAQGEGKQAQTEAHAAMGSWAPWTPAAPALAIATIADLDAGREWQAALGALIQILRDGNGWNEVTDLVDSLNSREDPIEFDAGAERDRPSHQRLAATIARIAQLPEGDRATHRGQLLDIAGHLQSPADLTPVELSIRFAAFDWDELTSPLSALALRLDRHPILSSVTMSELSSALDRDQSAWTSAGLDSAVARLLAQHSVGGGVLALALVQAAGDRYGWPVAWRDHLRALRNHPDQDVSLLARSVRTATE